MKKIYVIICLLGLTLSALLNQACNSDLLDTVNPNKLTTKEFWSTEKDAQLGVNACYAIFYRLGSWHRYLHWRFDLLSDEGYSMSPMVQTGEWTKFIYSDYNHDNNQTVIWREAYRGIFRANQVLTYVPGIEIADAKKKDAYLGQAYFHRAYNYFHLAVLWEEVPLVTELQNPGDQPQQVTLSEIWGQVEKDLLEASNLLPEEWTGAEKGRITKGAAKALLARAYMQQHLWEKAKEQLYWLVEGEGKKYYGLVDNYKHNFSHLTENNIESVFEIQFSDALNGGESDDKGATNGHQRSIIFGLSGIGFRDGLARPWLVDEYKKERTIDGKLDPRLRVSLLYKGVATDFPDEETGKFYGKTWDEGKWGNDVYYRKYSRDDFRTTEDRHSQLNFRVIRYADVLLMYAECLNELGNTEDAYTYVNMVRARAQMRPLQEAYPEIGNDKQKFLSRLQTERVLELNGECVRWFDIKRWELYNTPEGLAALIARDPDYKNFVVGVSHRQPLPSNEVANNPNMKQLDGY